MEILKRELQIFALIFSILLSFGNINMRDEFIRAVALGAVPLKRVFPHVDCSEKAEAEADPEKWKSILSALWIINALNELLGV
jgi:hypothetical protein